MSERVITALVVGGVILLSVFEGALGRNFRAQYPTAGNVAVWLGVLICAVGTWIYLKSPDKETEREKRRFWSFISLFIALVFIAIAIGGDEGRTNVATVGLGFFLLFSIGKIAHHDP